MKAGRFVPNVRRWMGGWVDGWMGGWVDGWMGGWVDGWMGGWVDGWMGGWVDGLGEGVAFAGRFGEPSLPCYVVEMFN